MSIHVLQMCNRHHHTTPLHDQGVKACTQPYASMSMCEGTTLYLPLIPSTPRIPNSSHGLLHVTYMLDHVDRPDPVMRRPWQLYNPNPQLLDACTIKMLLREYESVKYLMTSVHKYYRCAHDTLTLHYHKTKTQDMHPSRCSSIYAWRYDIIHTIVSTNTTNTK